MTQQPQLTQVTDLPAAPPRPVDAHKGTFGTVIVVGGSATMIGAPAICAAAAFRAGAGLVKIATSPEVLPFAIVIEPSATGVQLSGSAQDQLHAIQQADPDAKAVFAIGPGIGQADDAGEVVLALLRSKRPVVLDADGLNLLARTGEPRPANNSPLVMTPHPGEFARLAQPLNLGMSPTDSATRPDAAAALARAHQAIVVLKGQHTIISDGQRFYRNTTGNPALATAGSGDVLTGIIAAFIAQGMDPFDAACLATHIHGRAADTWAQAHGQAGLTAMTLCAGLPRAISTWRGATNRRRRIV